MRIIVLFAVVLGCSAAPTVDPPPEPEPEPCTKEYVGPNWPGSTVATCSICECPGQPCTVRAQGYVNPRWGICTEDLECPISCPTE